MKKRVAAILGSTVVAIFLLVGGTFWYVQTSSKQQKTISTTAQALKKESKDRKTLKASGYDYQITSEEALGGVMATPTSLTKILNKKTILDIVASIPGMNDSQLISATKLKNEWQVKVKRASISYKVRLAHYQNQAGTIDLYSNEIKQHKNYIFTIPEKYYAPYKEEDAKLTSSFSQAANSAVISSSSSEESPAESSSSKGFNNIQNIIAGKSFDIAPVLYDGEDVDKAMNENKAPQNLVHDGVAKGYFYDSSTVHLTGLGTYSGEYSNPYTINNKTINIGSQDYKNIPYSLNGNSISFQNWQTKTSDGHTITWQMKWDNNAQSYVDSKSQNP